ADQGKPAALPGFWFARLARIYPLWWLVLSALVAVWMVKPEWVYSSHDSSPELWKSYLLVPDKELPLHAVGWTLIHELWFYLAFGLMLLLPARWFPAALAVWAIVTAATAFVWPTPENPYVALIRHPLTLEFILGAVVGLLAQRRVFPVSRLMVQFGAFWMLISALALRENAPAMFSQEWPRLFCFGFPAALLVWGCVGLEQDGYKSPTWSKSLGDWSYALYLIHVPVFAALGRLGAPLSRPGPLDNLILLTAALAAAIIAAWILHVGFDRPIQRLAASLRGKRQAGG
ncbi:MAG: acyltransferase family protein, partial [Hyphomonadaceae bacterium]